MRKNLTFNEINGLYCYTQVQNIPYEDVQHELVDHIATAIENTSPHNKNDTFSKHMYEFLNTLPVDFFKDFLIQKRKTLTKLWWTRFKDGFTFKLLLASLILSIPIHFAIDKLITNINFKYEMVTFIILLIIIQFFILRFAHKRIRKGNAEKYLSIMHYTSVTTLIFSIIITSLLLLTWMSYSLFSSASLKIISLSFLLASINILAFHLPRKLEEDLKCIFSINQTLNK